MPKSRGSGNIGSAGTNNTNNTETNLIGGTPARRSSSGGAGTMSSIEEMAGRLLDRLSSMGPVNVEVESATRGRAENVQVVFDNENNTMATVLSDSGTRYRVDYEEDNCTCLNNRMRRVRCRHIDATHQALGQISQHESDNSPTVGETIHAEEIESVIDNQQILDMLAEEQRRDIQPIEEDDEFFYTENEVAFQEALARAATEELEYDYENALNGSQITFGLEIEFVGGDADAIARELYSLGICGYDRRVAYHAPSISGKWKLERDGSVSNGPSGGELVSPILRDTPETWRTLETICKVAKRHGARIDSKCGGHVHVGMDPLDTARQRWKRFFRTIGGFEDTAYRLAGGTEGRIRSGHDHYATPFQRRAQEIAASSFDMENMDHISSLARNVSQRNRYYGINLTNIYDVEKPNTVEFRYFNSSLDPRQLQANVKIANGIMMASEKARTKDDVESNIFPSASMKKRGKILKENVMGSNERTNHTGIKKFLDIVFTRKKDKDNMLRVYAKNQWRN